MADPPHLPPLPPEELSAIDAVERCLRQNEPLLACEAVQEGLLAFPASPRLRMLRGLALSRSGDTANANRLLSELADAGLADAETLAALARSHRDLALGGAAARDRREHLAAALRRYLQARAAARRDGAMATAWCCGIDAATVALLQGNLVTARRLAREVRRLCGDTPAQPAAASHCSREMILGEAALILGDAAESAAHYRLAAALTAGNHAELASARRRARLLAAQLPGDHDWIAGVLRIPPLAMYTGHMIDHPARAMPRFPPESEAAVAAAAHELVAQLRPLAAYGSAACGADIVWLEAMREVGGETHIVLPFPPADFHRISVDFAAGAWSGRFERALAVATSVTITGEQHAPDSSATFEYANFILTGMARQRAELLQAELRGLAIWDGNATGGGGGGAASLVDLWRSHHIDVTSLRLPQPGTRLQAPAATYPPVPHGAQVPAGLTHEIRAMLFADPVGCSEPGGDQTTPFMTRFRASIAELSSRTGEPPDYTESGDDGVWMVFDDVAGAVQYALALNGMLTGSDTRIALHSGPVYRGPDPLTGKVRFTGPNTGCNARIAPVTPPGQVYCSAAFAAVAAAKGIEGVAMRYVGHAALATGEGQVGLYHVTADYPSPGQSGARARG